MRKTIVVDYELDLDELFEHMAEVMEEDKHTSIDVSFIIGCIDDLLDGEDDEIRYNFSAEEVYEEYKEDIAMVLENM